MSGPAQTCDYLIVGAGIVGLSVALEISLCQPDARIITIEKELMVNRALTANEKVVAHD